MTRTEFDKQQSAHRAAFAKICEAHGGTFSEKHLTTPGSSAYLIPTRLGILRVSIHGAIHSQKRPAYFIGSVFLQFQTFDTGKVNDTLLGYHFNGYSGKWNIMVSAGTLAAAQDHALQGLNERLERLAEEPLETELLSFARSQGEAAGLSDARRYDQCPEDFEAVTNPYGVDTEAGKHENWACGYENAFEGNKVKP